MAAASRDEIAYAEAMTDVWIAGADVVIVKAKDNSGNGDGSSYDVSIAKFKAIMSSTRTAQ